MDTELNEYKKAIKIASKLLADFGNCTHFPGHVCDLDFPDDCPECIENWLLTKAKDCYSR
jgi:hypothetical protein